MSGCIVRNGAVIAQNAHVAKDVPENICELGENTNGSF